MTTDKIPLLDQLDEARAKGTPGEWFARDMEVYSTVGGTSTVAIEVGSGDAALIVAAVNALPKLTAALRAVLELIDPENGMATGNGYDSTRLFDEKDIRTAIARGLDGEA